jgi:predicted nucleic acid-binding protein
LATHLADTSALARLHHDDVLARVGPMFMGGRVATCAVVDLEVLFSARTGLDHAQILDERALYPRVPCGDDAFDRASAVQGILAQRGFHRSVPLADLLVAAAAELSGLIVLHYGQPFDVIAEVTGQPTEWVVPQGTVP